jgi:hypothetical protein
MTYAVQFHLCLRGNRAAARRHQQAEDNPPDYSKNNLHVMDLIVPVIMNSNHATVR